MEVAEEESGQIAKRQAIQEIMRDSSLTAQEKQQKIQQFMASGGLGAPAPTPPTVSPPSDPSPSPVPEPTVPPPQPASSNGGGSSSREAIQAAMRDTSLTSQERQKKIQEIMASGSRTTTPLIEPSSATAPEMPLPPAADATSARNAPPNSHDVLPASSKQALMQTVMRDTALTPQEKQKRIQEIMAGSIPATSPSSPPPPASSASSTPQQPASSNPSAQSATRKAMQEVMQDSSLTPQEKQKRIQEIMASSSTSTAAPAAAGAATAPGASSMASLADPGARKASRPSSRLMDTQSMANSTSSQAMIPMSGRSDDPAARKVARESATSTSSATPAAVPATPSLAAASSNARHDDPAARKMARESVRSVSSSTTTSAATAAAPNLADSSSAAARADDPAARKTSRESTRMSRAGSRASTASSQQRPSESPQQSAVASTTMSPQMHENQQEGISQPRSQSSYSEVDQRGSKAESAPPNYASPPPAAIINNEPEPQPEYGIENANSQPPRSIPSIQQQQSIEQPQPQQGARETVATTSSNAQPQAPPRSSSTSLGLSGADTGGIQAYVAGQQQVDENAVLATEVVTEEELEDEDKRKQRQYLWCGGCCFCCLVIIIVVILVLTLGNQDPPEEEGNKTESPSMAPSMAPTSSTYGDLLDVVRFQYNNETAFNEVFDDESSPQYRAAEWAANEAPIGLSGSDPRMLSRYTLATFYFATNGDDWTRCGRGSTLCDEGSEWLTAENECDWDSIDCNDDFSVRQIYFFPVSQEGNNVAGTLPLDLSFLSRLESFIVAGEFLTGTIPSQFSSLAALTSLILSENQFTGAFPDFLINDNPLLTTIYFSSNRLTGGLPSLSSRTLEDLRLSENLLTGPIPSSISNLPSLRFLTLESNDFSGTIPNEIYTLSSLRRLRLSNNTELAGTLSADISQMNSIVELGLANTGLGGTLPDGLFDLTSLQSLELSKASFSGILSESFQQLTNLDHLRLNNNTFQGMLPSAFANLTYLQELELHYNDLTGAVSEELCNRTGVGFGFIELMTADCLDDPPQLACDCCTCF